MDERIADVDMLSLIERDVQLERVAATNGGEWAGPCPFCPEGGRDRFRVWPRHPRGRGQWWCRRCGKSGDAISYLRERDGLGFGQALEVLDLRAGQLARRPARQAEIPDVEPPGTQWQARARAFLSFAQEKLWGEGGAGARAYLVSERGLSEGTIRAWGLGYNPLELRDRAARWGRAPQLKVYISAGIAIPCAVEGTVWYIQIRRPSVDRSGCGDTLSAYLDGVVRVKPQRKYWTIVGGRGKSLFGADRMLGSGRALLVCESEFDAMLAWQEIGDRVDVCAFGGARKVGRVLPARWMLRLMPYRVLLVAMDRDGAGRAGLADWQQLSRRAVPLQVPEGSDITDFYRAGGDLRAWISEALVGLAGITPGPTDTECGSAQPGGGSSPISSTS